MRAPILNLSSGAIERPHRLDLARLEALMLWPTDTAARDAWERAAILDVGADNLGDMPEAVMRHFTADALTAPRLADLMPATHRPGICGRVAGVVVVEALALRESGSDVRLADVIEAVCERYRGTYQLRPQTVNNEIRPRFRTVAHLWAAVVLEADGEGAFPCEAPALPRFLALAEAVRKRAEACRLKHAPTPLMKPGAAVSLPPQVLAKLPEVLLEIG